MIRTKRNWFFEGTTGPLGERFLTGNKPTKNIFRKLFDSILFADEVDDTAKENEAGHVKLANDNSVVARSVPGVTGEDGTTVSGTTTNQRAQVQLHSLVVQPHQLPNIELHDGTEVSVTDVAVSKGGLTLTAIKKTLGTVWRRNFRIALNLGGSLLIKDDKLELDGDIVSPADGLCYSIKDGRKGWNGFPAQYPQISSSTYEKVLSNNNQGLYWKTITSGGGSSLPTVDNESIYYNNEGELSVKLLPYNISGNGLGTQYANALRPSSNGMYIAINPQTLDVDSSNRLTVKSGGIIINTVNAVDDFLTPAIDTTKWDETNVIVATGFPNGGVVLSTIIDPASDIKSLASGNYDQAPTLEVRLSLKKAVTADGEDLPNVKIGLSGNNEVDFVGLVLRSGSVWEPALIVNSVDVTMDDKTLINQINNEFITLKVIVGTDRSAWVYVNDVGLGKVDAGIANFANTLVAKALVNGSNAHLVELVIDYINFKVDRSNAAYNYTYPP